MSNAEATALVEMLACPDSAHGAGTEPADDPTLIDGEIIYGEVVA